MAFNVRLAPDDPPPTAGLQPPRRRTAISEELVGLAAIYEPDVNVCHVVGGAAPLPTNLSPFAQGGTWRKVVQRDERPSTGMPEMDAHLSFLIGLLADLTGVESVGVRARNANASMCPRFHVDHIPLRLLCTYLGPGTQWLDEAKAGCAARIGDRDRHGVVRQAEPGDLVLLKGDGWHENEGGGAVHRSPPHDLPRLVVSLDPLK